MRVIAASTRGLLLLQMRRHNSVELYKPLNSIDRNRQEQEQQQHHEISNESYVQWIACAIAARLKVAYVYCVVYTLTGGDVLTLWISVYDMTRRTESVSSTTVMSFEY